MDRRLDIMYLIQPQEHYTFLRMVVPEVMVVPVAQEEKEEMVKV